MSSVVATVTNESGIKEYHLVYDPEWDGVESFAKYLVKHWDGVLNQITDEVYSRKWVVRIGDVPITIQHDSQKGNWFFREDGEADCSLLDQIKSDVICRMSD